MTDKYSKMFFKISSFKRRVREAPSRRMFRHLRKHPHVPIATVHNQLYRKAWPRDPFALQNEGVLLLAQNRPKEALALFDRATQIQPDKGQLWADKAVAFTALGRPMDALKAADMAVRFSLKSDPTPHNIRGVALAQLRRFTEAIRTLRHALFLKEDQAKTHRNLAGVYAFNSMTADAARHYKRALQLDPWFDPAYLKYCTCLMALDRRDEALAVMAARSQFLRRDTRVKPVDAAANGTAPAYDLPPAEVHKF